MRAVIARLLFVLVPGAGHIHQDRPGRGLLLFFLFLFFLNAAVFTRWYPFDQDLVRIVGGGGAAGIWLLAAVEYLAEARARGPEAAPEEEGDGEKPA